MRSGLIRIATLLGAAWAICGAALAGMPAGTIGNFSKVVQTGDPVAIVEAARAFGATAMAHPEDPQAGAAAFEAANQLCLRGACADAEALADFLAARRTALPVAPEQVDILTAYARWSAADRNEATDKVFSDVLSASAETPASLLSIAAYEAFYLDKVGTGYWHDIADRAGLAAGHFLGVRDAVPEKWITAELLSATAIFNDDQDFESYDIISALDAWLMAKRSAGSMTVADQLRDLHYQVAAWKTALHAYYKSAHSNAYEARFTKAEVKAASIRGGPGGLMISYSKGLPLCSGHVSKPPNPRYPGSKVRRGYIGAVLVGMDFLDGEPTNYRVLAAVPDDRFEKVVLKAMKKDFRWEWDEAQRNPACTKTRKDAYLYSFEFILGSP